MRRSAALVILAPFLACSVDLDVGATGAGLGGGSGGAGGANSQGGGANAQGGAAATRGMGGAGAQGGASCGALAWLEGPACASCLDAHCAPVVATAYGAGWMSGQPGGACATTFECLCACDDAGVGSCTYGCLTHASTSCTSADAAASSCSSHAGCVCDFAANASMGGAAGASGRGGAGAGGAETGGAGGASGAACEGLAACCAHGTFPDPGFRAACHSDASFGNEDLCANELRTDRSVGYCTN